MTTSEFKQFLASKKVESVSFENHIRGSREYVNIPGEGLQRVFIPFQGSIYADHKVCIRLAHSNYMWFQIWRKEDGTFLYMFDYVWKAGPGKKMRRDAAWNLCWDMMEETNTCSTDPFSAVEPYAAKQEAMDNEDGPLHQSITY